MYEIITIVIDRLKLTEESVMIKAYAGSREIKAREYLTALIELGSGPKAAKLLGTSPQTINRTNAKFITPVVGKLSGGGKSFRLVLLNLAEFRECSACGAVKPKEDFSNCSANITGKDLLCKNCKSLKNEKYYLSEKGQLAHSKSYDKNYEQILARNAKSRASRLLRVPAWTQTEDIIEFYKLCPEGHHVDHIVPLKGRSVSGLHVLENLQYLLASDNIKKGNKFIIK